MLKNPYTERLESFSFDEMAESLAAITSETASLDYKAEMIAKNELAYRACAFGNAEGGLIVIGVDDPEEGKSLSFASKLPATDDAQRLRVTGIINSRVHPPLPLDVMGYRSADGNRAMLVIRIGYSVMTPHEYKDAELPNFPVRRSSGTGRLSLGEIEILQHRRDYGISESPIRAKRNSLVPIVPQDGWYFVGMRIRPKRYRDVRYVMDVVDDMMCADIAHRTRGVRDRVHAEMILTGQSDSNYMQTKGWTRTPLSAVAANTYPPPYLGPPEELEIFSDGDIFLRRSQTDANVASQFFAMLLWGYATAQEVYYRFGLPPEIHVHVMSRFDERRKNGMEEWPDAYQDDFEVNLATQKFSDAFLETAIRFSRTAEFSPKRDDLAAQLNRISVETLSLGDVLQPRWLSGE